MNYLNKLGEAKRLANVEGAVLYVTDKGVIRKQLSAGEKQLYRVKYKKGTQYVYNEKDIQIIPKKEESTKAERKYKGKDTPKLQDSTNASMD